MSVISLAGARPWNIKVPQVVRYMEKKWVRHFFETGELLLTTFERCRTHEEKSRRDGDEGVARFNLENSTSSMGGQLRSGSTSYMLCGSLVESGTLMDKFSADGYFLINDPVQFADTIARWLPGFIEGYIGPCVYRAERRIHRKVEHALLPDAPFPTQRPEVEPSQEEMNNAMEKFRADVGRNIHQALGFDSFLCKDTSFSDEAEFRFVWTLSEEVKDQLVVKCPAALQFCSTHITIEKPYQASRPKGESGFFAAASKNPFEEQLPESVEVPPSGDQLRSL